MQVPASVAFYVGEDIDRGRYQGRVQTWYPETVCSERRKQRQQYRNVNSSQLKDDHFAQKVTYRPESL